MTEAPITICKDTRWDFVAIVGANQYWSVQATGGTIEELHEAIKKKIALLERFLQIKDITRDGIVEYDMPF